MSTTVRQATATRVMDLMDETGHTSLGWDASDDEWVLPMIRRKLAEGFTFWIVKRNPLREVQLERVEDLGDAARHVIIRDAESRQLFEAGRIGLAAANDEPVETVRRATTAEEAVQHDTVAHRPLRGG
jgi:hypothetical protein